MNKKGIKSPLISKWMSSSNTYVLIATVIIAVAFSMASENFLSAYNIFTVTRTAGLYIFIALGQAMIISLGGSNLALGQLGGLATIVSGYCMQELGVGILPGIVIAITTGILAGFINGILIVKLKLSAFIVTLSTQFIYAGLITGISEGFPFTELPEGFTYMGSGSIGGVIPHIFTLAVITVIILWYIFRYTTIGRRFLATGGNIEAAKMAGVKTDFIILLGHMASGFFAAIAGLLWTSRMAAAQPSTGKEWMLISFAVAVIGGTGIKGGTISPIALITSSILMVMIKNGLVLLNTNVYYEQTYLGLIILLAISLDSIRPLFAEWKLKRELRKESKKSIEA